MGHSARAARRAAAVVAGASLCVLASPALAAKDAPSVSTPIVTVEVPVSHGRHGERPGKGEVAPPPPPLPAPPAAPSPPEAPEAGHRHRGQNGGRLPAPLPAAPNVASAHGHHYAGGHGSAGANATDEANGAGETVAAAVGSTGKAVARGVESLARKQRKPGGGEKSQKVGGGKKRKEREREEHEKEQPVGTEGESSNGHTGTSEHGRTEATASSATSAPSSPTPSVETPVATPAAALAPAATQGVAASGSRANRAGHKAQKAHRRAAKHRGATPVTPAAAVTSPAAATGVATGSGGGSGGPRPKSGVGGSYTHSSEPAIVHTITRIVNVVPAPMRVLIAALAALALAFGLRSLLAGVRTRRLLRQRSELLEDVGLLQAALLPEPPAQLGAVGTSVAYRPADGPGAGGDFYDVFALDADRFAVIVGDVSGHGRDALPHTALIRFTVRAYLEAGLDPAMALQTAGAVLERQLGGSFATVLVAVYDPRERKLTYASAGHPPPLVIGEPDASGTTHEIAPVTACSAPPLGAGMRSGTRQTTVAVPGPAHVCVFTDGVTEARVGEAREELFGTERLSRALATLPADGGAAELLDRVAAKSSARPDDMAACVLHVRDGAGAPAIVSERVELDGDALAGGRVQRFLELSGVSRHDAAAAVDRAQLALAHSITAMVELTWERGAPVVTVHDEPVIRTTALGAVVGAGR